MQNAFRILCGLLVVAAPALAREKAPRPQLVAGAIVYVDQMNGGLDIYLIDRMKEKGLPLNSTRKKDGARYELVGSTVSSRMTNPGAVIQIVDLTSGEPLWSGSVGNSFGWTGSGQAKSAARRLVSKMQKEIDFVQEEPEPGEKPEDR